MFLVHVSRKAEKSVAKMPKHYVVGVKELLIVLESEPVPAKMYHVEKLGGADNEYRIRIGDIRVVYSVEWALEQVEVMKIEWRGRVYK